MDDLEDVYNRAVAGLTQDQIDAIWAYVRKSPVDEDKAQMLHDAVNRVYAWHKTGVNVPPGVSMALGMMSACTLEKVRQLEGKTDA